LLTNIKLLLKGATTLSIMTFGIKAFSIMTQHYYKILRHPAQ
jgi:hypothetical protein